MVIVFNDYFTFVFTEEDTSHFPPSAEYTNIKCTDVKFTVADVNDKLAKLRPDKAADPDNLLPRFLLEITDFITYTLFLLFRKSLDENIVPADWNCANISPIYKKGNRNKADNYRPISLTSQICKIFESIIRDTVVKHIKDNLLISDSQHGFRRGRSCLTNLLTFLDKVKSYVDTGDDVDAVFLDFAKAFDKVPYMRLTKIEKSWY